MNSEKPSERPTETYREHFNRLKDNKGLFDLFFDKCVHLPCTRCRLGGRPGVGTPFCISKFEDLPFGSELDKNKMPVEERF